jgi:hypothetical protein
VFLEELTYKRYQNGITWCGCFCTDYSRTLAATQFALESASGNQPLWKQHGSTLGEAQGGYCLNEITMDYQEMGFLAIASGDHQEAVNIFKGAGKGRMRDASSDWDCSLQSRRPASSAVGIL